MKPAVLPSIDQNLARSAVLIYGFGPALRSRIQSVIGVFAKQRLALDLADAILGVLSPDFRLAAELRFRHHVHAHGGIVPVRLDGREVIGSDFDSVGLTSSATFLGWASGGIIPATR